VVAVIAATVVTELAGLRVARVEVGGLANWFGPDNRHRFVTAASPALIFDPWVWEAAVVIALIASAETLLCAAAVDSKHNGPRTQFNRELAAQGVGNILCGAVGALPMTGVIVRSSANLQAGAKTRWSAIFHGVWLLLFAALLTSVLARVPMAALAAVLVFSGWKLLDLPAAYRLWRLSRPEGFVLATTFLLVVLTDLLTGVVIGLVLSAARLLWVFSHMTIRREEPEPGRLHLHLEGAATFLRLPHLADALAKVPTGATLHIHLDKLRMVDHAILELLMKFETQYEAAGGEVYMDWERLHAHFRSPGKAGVAGPENLTRSTGGVVLERDERNPVLTGSIRP
jgi:MFS superfamily sulfate permease-like transporter